MNTFRAIVLAGLSYLLWSPLPALAGDFVIGDYSLVSSKRISRTVYENTYKADVSNWGAADVNITASLTSTAPQITVVEGGLSFGDVPIGATIESSDTFTVRHDRSKPFDEDALVWAPQATPLPPTTFELINKALNDGLIDAETALVYRVFDEFTDGRLPTQYRGRDDGFFEATAIREARELFNTLSPATQQLLAPFLFVPDVTEIPLSTPQSATSAGAMIAAVPSNTMNITVQPTATAAVAPTNLSGIWAVPNVVHIAWENDNPAMQTYLEDWAQKSAAEIKNTIWPKLTGLFGNPAPGKLVGIMLTPTGLKRSEETSEDCTITKIRLASQSVNTLAHELTHALVDLKYPEKCNASDTLWLHEATATWAEHFVYPKNNREHESAPSFLYRPEVELEKYERSSDDRPKPEHQYGAYLWFFYITRGVDSGAHYVRETWDAIATHDSLGAINQAIGSLEDEWPKFVLYNWNRVAKGNITTDGVTSSRTETGEPYRYYAKWDSLQRKAKEKTPEPVKVRLNGKTSVIYPLDFSIPHLAASYFHYNFKTDTSIRSLTLTHPYSGDVNTTARVQVIAKIRNQDWKPAEDWTSYASKSLCLDKPAEDVEELVVVISDSEFTNRKHSLGNIQDGPTELKVSALGCSPFIGTVDYSSRILDTKDFPYSTDVTETATTNVTFDLAPLPPDLTPPPDVARIYVATSGSSVWSSSGTITKDGVDKKGNPIIVTCSGATSGTVSVVSPELALYLYPFSLPFIPMFYEGHAWVPNMLIFYPCNYDYGPEGSYFGGYAGGSFEWFKTFPGYEMNPLDTAVIDPDGSLVLRGDYMEEDSERVVKTKWHWDLKQVRRPR